MIAELSKSAVTSSKSTMESPEQHVKSDILKYEGYLDQMIQLSQFLILRKYPLKTDLFYLTDKIDQHIFF